VTPLDAVTVGADDRSHILRYAMYLLPPGERGDAVKVSAAALPLLEWAEQAADADDLRDRMDALCKQHYGQRDSDDEEDAADPAAFVDNAGVLYAFLRGGRGGS
jgi:hypothetical protein